MIPIKARDLIADFAATQGIPEQDAADIINGFYRREVAAMSNLETNRLSNEGLGNFKTSYTKLNKEKSRLKSLLKNNFLPKVLYAINKTNAERIDKLIEEHEQEFERETKFRNKAKSDAIEGTNDIWDNRSKVRIGRKKKNKQ